MKDRITIPPEAKPILAGLLIFGAGVLIRSYQPGFLNVSPTVTPAASARARFKAGQRGQGIAVGLRDALLTMLPKNFMDWLGRGLITIGGAMAAAKLLDLVVDEVEDETELLG